MIFSPDHAVLYVTVPKTGCTTIKTIVGASVGLLDRQALSGASMPRIHNAWREIDEKWSDLTEETRQDMLYGDGTYRFTSVRNPYERIVSCYLNKIIGGNGKYYLAKEVSALGDVTMLSFLRYVADQPPLSRDVHCRAMVDLCFTDQLTYADIIRYETFEADLRRVMERLNLAGEPIPEATGGNRTDAGTRLRELLGPDEVDLIKTIYRRDFEEFGYSFDLPA